MLTEIRGMQRAFSNWPQVLLAAVLWKTLELPGRTLTLRLRSGGSFRAPLAPNIGALYTALDVFALNAYEGPFPPLDGPVVDVGANIGAFAMWAADNDARGLAFEPDPDAFATLKSNLRHYAPNVIARPAAVGATRGRMRLHRARPGDGTSSLSATSHVSVFHHTIEVDVVNLEDVVAEVGEPIAQLKLDCEGAEYEIVLDSPDEAWTDIRRVVIEYHPAHLGPERLIERLTSRGYDLLEHRRRPQNEAEGTLWFARSSSTSVSSP